MMGEEYSTRESRRIKMALRTARLTTIKMLAGYDFSFQPSLECTRVLVLAHWSSSSGASACTSSDRPAPARAIWPAPTARYSAVKLRRS